VLAILVGAAVALIVFGLPLAILALFLASILDRRNKRTVESAKKLIGDRMTNLASRDLAPDDCI
jgi:hypothetical protein